MTGEALIRALVMDAIANDYEDLKMVVDEVTEWAKGRGVAVAPAGAAAQLDCSSSTSRRMGLY